MSDPMTSVVVGGQSCLLVRGHVTYDQAVVECRNLYEAQLAEAQAVLTGLAAGDVRVFHQRGIHVSRNRREVFSVGAEEKQGEVENGSA